MSIVDGYVPNVGLPIITSRAHLFGAALIRWRWWIGFGWVVGLRVFAGVGFFFAGTHARVMPVALVLGSAASSGLSDVVVNNVADRMTACGPPTADRRPPTGSRIRR